MADDDDNRVFFSAEEQKWLVDCANAINEQVVMLASSELGDDRGLQAWVNVVAFQLASVMRGTSADPAGVAEVVNDLLDECDVPGHHRLRLQS